MVQKCVVLGCKSKWYPGCSLIFHSFPTDPIRKDLWLPKTMSEEEKDSYYEVDLMRMRSDRYLLPEDVESKEDIITPKRALSAFFWFTQDERANLMASNPTLTTGDIARELARLWVAADPETKAKYEAIAEQDQKRYEKELKQQAVQLALAPSTAKPPRGRMSAYAFFVQAQREEHKKKHPDEDLVFATFSKMCKERWNTMSEKGKERFHEMEEQDKIRYDREVQNYVPPKEPEPEPCLSAFGWFAKDEHSNVRANNPTMSEGNINRELARLWDAADPDTKAKYEAIAEQDQERYDEDMMEYKLATEPEEEISTPIRPLPGTDR